jgi:hypothetical protein
VTPVLPMALSCLPLTWVAQADASTTTLDIWSASSGPGSYPDRLQEGVRRCRAEGRDGSWSSHRVTPCASRGLCVSGVHAAITVGGAEAKLRPCWAVTCISESEIHHGAVPGALAGGALAGALSLT